MTGGKLLVLIAFAVVAAIAVYTLTGRDDVPSAPPPTPGESGDGPGEGPFPDTEDPEDGGTGPGDVLPTEPGPGSAAEGFTSLLVKVVDDSGKPVAGASLRLLEVGKYRTGSFGGAEVDQILMGIEVVDEGADPPGSVGTTSGDGSHLFEGVEPGKYFVGVLAAGRSPGEGFVEVPEKGSAEVTVEVGPGTVLAGKVVDSRGNPVPGARVMACVWHEMVNLPYASMEMAASGGNGTFRFTSAVPDKRHILCARAPDGRIAISVRVRAPKEDILLKVGKRITLVGKVYEEGTGIPVAGAKLFAMLGTAESLEDGSYRLEGVAKSIFFRWVMIRKAGYQQKYHALDFTTMFGGTEITVDFTITKLIPGRILLSARDLDGNPLPGVAVTVTKSGDEELKARGITDSRGELELEDVPPRRSHVEAMKPGYVMVNVVDLPNGERYVSSTPRQWLTLEPGGEATVEVVLARSAALRGVVRDPEGKPIEGVQLEGSFHGEATTDKEGRFELPKLPGGVRVGIQFTKEGFVPGHLTVDPSVQPEVEVTLQRGGSISGRALDPAGNPVSKARVTLWREKGEHRAGRDRTDGTGAFEFSQLASGRYVIQVAAKGYATTKSRPLEVGAGEATVDVAVVLTPGIRATVLARTEDEEKALFHAWLHGPLDLPEAERLDLSCNSFETGSSVIRVSPGRFRIAMSPAMGEVGLGAVEETVEITADGEIALTFRGKPRFITARLPSNANAGSLQISRTDPPTPRIFIWAPHPEGGTISSQALPPGKYKVNVYYSSDDSDSWIGREFRDVEPGGPALEVGGD